MLPRDASNKKLNTLDYNTNSTLEVRTETVNAGSAREPREKPATIYGGREMGDAQAQTDPTHETNSSVREPIHFQNERISMSHYPAYAKDEEGSRVAQIQHMALEE